MKKLNGKSAICASVVIASVCIAVRLIFGFENYSTGNIWGDMLLDLFVRENEFSYFPFTVWIIFPIIGYGAAIAYKKNQDNLQVLKFVLIAGVVSILISEGMIYSCDIPNAALIDTYNVEDGLYYSMHPTDILCSVGIIALEFCAAAYVMKLTNNYLPPIVTNMSRNVMEIYIAQWVIIGCLAPQIFKIDSMLLNMAASVAILAASYIIVAVYKSFRRRLAR